MIAAAPAFTHDLPLARHLARSALAVTLTDLPEEAVAKAKDCLLDFIACALEARDLPWSRQALATVRPMENGANIIGSRISASPADAAFVNATLGHGLVREDMHAGSICHHGVVIWPALLALAQRTRVSGESLLTAAIVGYEAGGRIGRILITSDLARLFRPTGLVGPLGAVLGAAAMLDLTESAATTALSIAANTSSGLNQWPHEGGSEMYFHPAFAARNVVTAIELAEHDAYGSESILEGEAGLFAAFRRERPRRAIELFPGGPPEILNVYNKPVPACNFAQTACQAALSVSRRMADDDLSGVRSILIRVPSAAMRYPGCDAAGPFGRALQAKMSIQFGVAATLRWRRIAERNYALLDDPEVERLLSITQLEEDPTLSERFPAVQGAEVRVSLEDGALIMDRLDDVIPASSREIRERFREAATEVLGEFKAVEIEKWVDRLESETDAGRIALLCSAPAPSGRGGIEGSAA